MTRRPAGRDDERVVNDEAFMQEALAQARLAMADGEVPVGAVLVHRGQVIATGRNAPIEEHDPTAHAEIMALRAAAQVLGNYRLDDCEMFVTLEPCAMCSGAMLHARLKRVVFGARDPKTGAAGSVVDLFSQSALNHQTQVQGGVLDSACAALLQSFFKDRRTDQRAQARLAHPLRDDALRTPEQAFDRLPDYPWAPRYVSDLHALAGLRMHYLDECRTAQPTQTWLLLHGHPAWSYLYRHLIPLLLAAGHRVVAPDLIGFGKSDKPKKEGAHHLSWHRQVLLELVARLDLQPVVVVGSGYGGLLGMTLPMADPSRFVGLMLLNTASRDAGALPEWGALCAQWSAAKLAPLLRWRNPQLDELDCAAYNAPFPDRGHAAAVRAFASPSFGAASADAVALTQHAEAFVSRHLASHTRLAAGAADPLDGLPSMQSLSRRIGSLPCTPEVFPGVGDMLIDDAERAAALAARALALFPGPERT